MASGRERRASGLTPYARGGFVLPFVAIGVVLAAALVALARSFSHRPGVRV